MAHGVRGLAGVAPSRARPRARRPRRRLRLKTVLVTGASSGIGRATALRLARAGWRVFAGVRREEDAPEGTDAVLLDVTDEEQVRAAREVVGGSLDGLVNNAGIALAGPLEFMPIEQLRRQLEINLVGQVAVTQALLPAVRAARGRIVNVGSIAGLSALPFLAPYAASKFALEAVTDALRVELAPFGVRVSIIEPGTIATPIWTKGAQLADEIAATLPPEAPALYGERIAAFRAAAAAAGRRGEPPEAVAAAIEDALTSPKPKTRYIVGKDARRRARLERLPDRIRDRLLTRFLFGKS